MTIERLEEDIKKLGTLHNQDQQFEEIMLSSQLVLYKLALRKGCLKKATDGLAKHGMATYRPRGKRLSI